MFLLISQLKRQAEIYWVAAINQADLLSVFLVILQKKSFIRTTAEREAAPAETELSSACILFVIFVCNRAAET